MTAGAFIASISITEADTERRVVSMDLYGYHTTPPAAGDMVRAWIMGPIFQGYWMDPGRSLICGNQPTDHNAHCWKAPSRWWTPSSRPCARV